jgi:hypothetical protein
MGNGRGNPARRISPEPSHSRAMPGAALPAVQVREVYGRVRSAIGDEHSAECGADVAAARDAAATKVDELAVDQP